MGATSAHADKIEQDKVARFLLNNRSLECPSCHAIVSDDQNYCGSCGEPITEYRVAFITKLRNSVYRTGALVTLVAIITIAVATTLITSKLDTMNNQDAAWKQSLDKKYETLKRYEEKVLKHIMLEDFSGKHKGLPPVEDIDILSPTHNNQPNKTKIPEMTIN